VYIYTSKLVGRSRSYCRYLKAGSRGRSRCIS